MKSSKILLVCIFSLFFLLCGKMTLKAEETYKYSYRIVSENSYGVYDYVLSSKTDFVLYDTGNGSYGIVYNGGSAPTLSKTYLANGKVSFVGTVTAPDGDVTTSLTGGKIPASSSSLIAFEGKIFDSVSNAKNFLDNGSLDGLISSGKKIFDESSATYDENIGYIKDLSLRVYNEDNGFGGNVKVYDDSTNLLYKWSDSTSTGLYLYQDNIRISFYAQDCLIYKANRGFLKWEEIEFRSSVYYVKSVEMVSGLTALYGDIDVLWDVELHSYLDINAPNGGAAKSNDMISWFRVEVYNESTNSWSYGPWTRYTTTNGHTSGYVDSVDNNGNLLADKVNDYDDVFEFVENPTLINPDDVTIETEDLSNFENEVFAIDSIDDAVTLIKGMGSGLIRFIGEFPSICKECLGFLPESFIYIMYFGLLMCVVLRVVGR